MKNTLLKFWENGGLGVLGIFSDKGPQLQKKILATLRTWAKTPPASSPRGNGPKMEGGPPSRNPKKALKKDLKTKTAIHGSRLRGSLGKPQTPKPRGPGTPFFWGPVAGFSRAPQNPRAPMSSFGIKNAANDLDHLKNGPWPSQKGAQPLGAFPRPPVPRGNPCVRDLVPPSPGSLD